MSKLVKAVIAGRAKQAKGRTAEKRVMPATEATRKQLVGLVAKEVAEQEGEETKRKVEDCKKAAGAFTQCSARKVKRCVDLTNMKAFPGP